MRFITLIAMLMLASGCSDDDSNGAGGSGGVGGSGGAAGVGGSGSACSQRLAFALECPAVVAVDAVGEVTVESYDFANINQLSFGAAGGGRIDPPAFQEPNPADATTNVPPAPYSFTFTGRVEGEVTLTVTSFDLSELDCLFQRVCTFDVVVP